MKRIMNIVDMASNIYIGWDIDWSTNKVSVLYWSIWEYFDYPTETEVRRERETIDLERKFNRLGW